MDDLLTYLNQLSTSAPEAFPRQGAVNYAANLRTFSDRLNVEVHSQVGMAALVRGGDYLTDHGPDHIRAVVRRASELVFGFGAELTPYEMFMLLAAIQIHDAGNVYGREEHERGAASVVERFGDLLGADIIERRWLVRIARAHGGSEAGDKDTISRLPIRDAILGQPVRVQLLAAILRLADEFADDRTRAARFPMASGLIPRGSEIFHKYAEVLQSVMLLPERKRAELHFTLETADAVRRWGKRDGEEYLLDEIFARTLKTYDECRYCIRYMKQAPGCGAMAGIDEIGVRIEVMRDIRAAALDSPAEEVIAYTLEQRGYPQSAPRGIYELCPELGAWTGASLKESLENRSLTNAP